MSDSGDKLVLTVAQFAFVTGEWAQLARDRQCFNNQNKGKQRRKHFPLYGEVT